MDRTLYTTLLAYSATLLLLYLLYAILSPFLGVLVWAGALGVITYPLYEMLLTRCNGREIVASALMMTCVVLALFVPLTGLLFILSQEATVLYHSLERASAGGSGIALGDIMSHPVIAHLREKLLPLTGPLNMELGQMVLPAVKNGLSSILNYSTGIAKNFLGFIFKLVLMMITLFFIYKDGLRFQQRCWQVLPVRKQLRANLNATVGRVLGAVMYGVILTCLVQGTLGGLGFWAAGLPSPFLFGTLMAVCAPVPLIGTALVWLPGAIYLLIQGKTLHGVLLIVWGVLVVSSIDNIIRPLFISGKAQMPILLIVFGVLGGLLAFGLSGVVAGPVMLAVIMVFFESEEERLAP